MIRAASLLALALAIAGAAAGAAREPFPVREASFPTSRLGWAPNYSVGLPCRAETICATDDGGRTWRTVFAVGSFLRDPVRTSALAGVVLAGPYPFWTRNGGRTWFEMERPPASSPGLPDPTPPRYQGRGNLLFVHYGGRTLYRVVPWPSRAEPPCTARGPEPARRVCGVPPANGGLEYRAVHTLERDALGPMANVPGGIVALVTGDRRAPAAVLLHRLGRTTLRRLPPPPASHLPPDFSPRVAASWPWLFVVAHSRTAFWWSRDGGRTWGVVARRTEGRARTRLAAAPTGAKAPLAGGWIAAVRARPALAIRQAGRTRTVTLPLPRSCRAATLARPRADWPFLYVDSRSGRARWWSDDGGRTWAVSGRC